MSTFKFQLATVLRLREATRDERRADLAQALAADEQLQLREQALELELANLQSENRKRASGPAVDIDWLLDAQHYQLALRVEQQSIAADRQKVAKEIEHRREALMESDRDVRVLEKLRDVQAQRHRANEERQEMKQIDEVAGRKGQRGDTLSDLETPTWAG